MSNMILIKFIFPGIFCHNYFVNPDLAYSSFSAFSCPCTQLPYLSLICNSETVKCPNSDIHHFLFFKSFDNLRFADMRVIAVTKTKIVTFSPKRHTTLLRFGNDPSTALTTEAYNFSILVPMHNHRQCYSQYAPEAFSPNPVLTDSHKISDPVVQKKQKKRAELKDNIDAVRT